MSLPSVPLELGEWLPDLPPLENPGALIAKNVISEMKSYRSLNSLAAFTSALTEVCVGAIWFQASDNTVLNFAGDASRLYRLDGGVTWTNVSQAGNYTNVANWEFAKFGDRAIAVAAGEDAQYYDAGVSSLFADLGGSPPVAARIAVIRDFIVLGDLEAFGPNFVAWSGFNSSELWTPSRATQSDRQELFGRGGRVQKIVPGEYGVIVQEHSIHRMDYVGPPVIFQFDEVERGRGTPAPNSVVWTGNLVFYLGHDGFYLFNGQSSAPIGADRVNRWFAQNADVSGLSSMRGAVDRQNRLVLWAFRSSASLLYNDRLIIFNWSTNRWSYAEIDTEVLAEFVSSGFSLDQLDTPLPGGIDTDSIAVDSAAFKGGALGLQAFNTSHESATFSGAALVAEIDTAEYRGSNGRRLYTNAQRPIVDGSSATEVTVALGRRDDQKDNVVFGTAQATNRNGQTRIRRNARYHRYRLSISGGFNHAHGLEVDQREAGSR
mgnify:CR=1 FL=1